MPKLPEKRIIREAQRIHAVLAKFVDVNPDSPSRNELAWRMAETIFGPLNDDFEPALQEARTFAKGKKRRFAY